MTRAVKKKIVLDKLLLFVSRARTSKFVTKTADHFIFVYPRPEYLPTIIVVAVAVPYRLNLNEPYIFYSHAFTLLCVPNSHKHIWYYVGTFTILCEQAPPWPTNADARNIPRLFIEGSSNCVTYNIRVCKLL